MSHKNVALVSIIIVSFNRKKDVLECLESVKQSDYDNTEVIVVDNGSTDGTSEALGKLGKSIKVVRAGRDLGPASAFNIGMKNAKGQLFLLLNDDVVLEKDAISQLVRVAKKDSRVGIVGSLIYYYSDRSKLWMYPSKFLGYKQKYPYLDVITIIGCCILVNRAVIDSIGYLDDEYFFYHEEVDFCLRARKQGFRVVCALQSSVFHKIPLMSYGNGYRKHAAVNAYYSNRNNFLFATKNYETTISQIDYLFRTFLFYPDFIKGSPQLRNFPWVAFLKALATFDIGYLVAYVRGFGAGLTWFMQQDSVKH